MTPNVQDGKKNFTHKKQKENMVLDSKSPHASTMEVLCSSKSYNLVIETIC